MRTDQRELFWRTVLAGHYSSVLSVAGQFFGSFLPDGRKEQSFLDVEFELDDIVRLHDVGFALGADFAVCSRSRE